MTQTQPPAAPSPTPTPSSLADSDASAAAQARLDNAFPAPNQPGTPDASAPAPAAGAPDVPVDLFSDEGIDSLNFDNLQYRDGARLRAEIVKARDTYRPFRDAFGSLDDAQRQSLLENAPTLGADLAVTTAVMARMHPDDRAYFQQAMDLLSQDPLAGAEMLAEGARSIRAAQGITEPAAPAPGTQPAPDWAQPAPDGAAAPETLTRADMQAEFDARDRQALVKDYERQITAQARELGYDPDAQQGTEAADRFAFLLSVAGQPDVGHDLGKAHERVGRLEQAAIDRFVQAKSADAGRPAAPAGAGVAPAETRTLETMTDGAAAMRERLAANLGPDPRARGAED